MFESFVNSERCKTNADSWFDCPKFESFVNSERCKTVYIEAVVIPEFESFVNSERCKTNANDAPEAPGLRALLIQKDVKHYHLSSGLSAV